MGTMIHLYLGKFQIDCGKNNYFNNHSGIFQSKDYKNVVDFGYSELVTMGGCSRPLRDTVGRLELLGYTLSNVKQEYISHVDEWGEIFKSPVSFKKMHELIRKINIADVTGEWIENKPIKFLSKELIAKLNPYHHLEQGSSPDYWELEMLLGNFSPYSKLRLLAENENNLDLNITWPFEELVESGWTTKAELLKELSPNKKFLIITEGSSDSKILQKALSLLKPQYADFFKFIDMEEGYPFTGTGNLYKFSQGLASIGVLNKIIILFDNDAEGASKYAATQKLKLPSNMVAVKLPKISSLRGCLKNRDNLIQLVKNGPFRLQFRDECLPLQPQ